MKHAAVVSLLLVAGCFSKPSFGGRDGGAGSDTGGGEMGGGDDAMIDAMIDAPDGPPPVQLAIAKLSAGGRHTCAIGNDSRLWCWGDNDHGQLGDSPLPRSGDPVLASTTMTSGWTDIAAGQSHTCGIRAGIAYCWGLNEAKQAKPTMQGGDVPMTMIAGLPAAPMKIFAGEWASCVILADTTARCWGALNLGANLGGGMPDYTTFGVLPLSAGAVTTWSSIAIGNDHACAIAAGGADDGKLFCWGADTHNGLGADLAIGADHAFTQLVETRMSGTGERFLSVDAATYVTCAITTSNDLYCWGSSGQGHLLGAADNSLDVPIDTLQTWASVAIDETFACARTSGGTVQCWGNDRDGALGQGDFQPQLSTPVSVTVHGLTTGLTNLVAGSGYACVLDPNVNAYCWGANRSGELGNREIATKDAATRVRLPVLGANDVVRKIVAGFDFTCALIGPATGAATAYCWGKNETKQVSSQAATLAEELPTLALPAGTTFSDITAGEMHACGLGASGATLTCWGDNSMRQLGRTGTAGTQSHNMPAALPWTAVAAGSRASCGISDGQLYCWGDVPGEFAGVQTTPKAYGRTPNGGSWQSLQIGSGFALGIAIDIGETYPTLMSFGSKCEGGTGTTGIQGINNAVFIKKGMFGSAADEYAVLVIAAAQHAGRHTCLHFTTMENATPRVTCFGHNEANQINATELDCSGSSGDQTAVTWRMPVVGTQSIATANSHSCVLAGNNALQCWGANNAHELSNRSVSNPGVPAQVPPSSMGPWSGVTTGNTHTCVIDDPKKAVYCWGENRHGQLGDGTRFRPAPVASGLVLP